MIARFVQDYWPWLFGGVLVLALAILAAMVLLLRKSAKVAKFGQPEEQPAEKPAKPAADADYARIGAVFRRARRRLRQRGDGNAHRAPLVLLLGAEGSREPGFLRRAGAGLELFEDPLQEGLAFAGGREFLFFDSGTVLDVAGEPVLGSDGQHADDGTWRRIVRELVSMRPKRPLDALVVTVGCGELLEAATSEAARVALAERADRVRRRLWDLQDAMGFRLPLYVLVTSGELLRGFGETCAALPPAARLQILGWSSPHGAHGPYQTSWIDAAFAALRQTLGDLQMELFRAAPQADGVLLFPESVDALAEPLRTFLDTLLNPGARHEGSIARGIYLCGSVPETQVTAFAAELFNLKIFPEIGLAVPTGTARMARTRRARVLQIATAVTAVAVVAGLAIGQTTLSERHDRVRDALGSSLRDQMQRKAAGTITPVELDKAAYDLVNHISAVDFRHVSPWWLPASSITGFDRRMQQALAQAFGWIVLDAIYDRIDGKAKAVIGQASSFDVLPARDDDAEAALEPVGKSEELLRLQKFVTDLREVERQGALFQRVKTVGVRDDEALNATVKYAFGTPLPPRFFGGTMTDAALKNLTAERTFNPKDYSDDATAALNQNITALFAKFFHRNPCERRVARIASAIDPVGLQLAAQRDVDVEAFQKLDLLFHALQKDLSAPETEYAFRQKFDLGPELDNVLDGVGHSAMFAPRIDVAIRNNGEKELWAMQQSLAQRTRIDTPILSVRADHRPAMELSRDSELLHTALETFLGQSFVQRDAVQIPIRISEPGYRLFWNEAQLDQATAAFKAYKDFREKGLKLFPRNLSANVTAAIEQTARQRTRIQLGDLLAAAQRFVPVGVAAREDDVQLAAATFDLSSKSIRAPLDSLQALDALGTRDLVVKATSAEAMRLLRSVDELLAGAALYEPRNATFDWWDGSAALGTDAWGARDANELAEYLEITRGRVAALSSRYAAPALAWFNEFGLPAGERDAATVRQWRQIAEDLKSFENKKPGNAPAMLADYIERASKLTPSDCKNAELKPSERAAQGYFGDRLRHDAGHLSTRCLAVATDRAAAKYGELADLFNQRLAGHYPFSDEPPRAGDAEADPEDIRRFFKKYDEVRPLFTAVDDARTRWFAPAQDFVDKMDKVRELFAPYLDPKKSLRLPEVNVEPAFRILPEREAGANEVIRWSLALGNDTATQRDKKTLHWHPGTPVRLTLWWAADAPRVPVLASARRYVSVEDRAVVYRYENRWSLLTALRDLRAPLDDLPGGADQQPVTLAVSVQTQPVTADPNNRDVRPPSLLFLRFALTNTDGQPVNLPSFPPNAQALTRR